MAAEAEAAREARAKVIAAEGEKKASRALREASEVISESPSALQVKKLKKSCSFYVYVRDQLFCSIEITHLNFQLRYLQTLNTISAEKNSTIIFPVPMDVISHFLTKKAD